MIKHLDEDECKLSVLCDVSCVMCLSVGTKVKRKFV